MEVQDIDDVIEFQKIDDMEVLQRVVHEVTTERGYHPAIEGFILTSPRTKGRQSPDPADRKYEPFPSTIRARLVQFCYEVKEKMKSGERRGAWYNKTLQEIFSGVDPDKYGDGAIIEPEYFNYSDIHLDELLDEMEAYINKCTKEADEEFDKVAALRGALVYSSDAVFSYLDNPAFIMPSKEWGDINNDLSDVASYLIEE